jgi:VIT1/CCC1 family predicted Fe2+/Mn2+ transporter
MDNGINPKIILSAIAVAIIGLLVALYIEVSPFTEIGWAALVGGVVILVVHIRRSQA